VQNDLQELFAITSFVAPGLLGGDDGHVLYMVIVITIITITIIIYALHTMTWMMHCCWIGSLTEFKSRYSNAINQANDVHCSAAAQESGSSAISELQTQLQTIMLRRTQEQVLNSLLPKRTDYVVYCGCTREQELQYRAAAEDIKR
jgi:SNF2 family DNA or RNA helicase